LENASAIAKTAHSGPAAIFTFRKVMFLASMSMQDFAHVERKATRQNFPFLLRAPKALKQQYPNFFQGTRR
jgi:hypothetical protein